MEGFDDDLNLSAGDSDNDKFIGICASKSFSIRKHYTSDSFSIRKHYVVSGEDSKESSENPPSSTTTSVSRASGSSQVGAGRAQEEEVGVGPPRRSASIHMIMNGGGKVVVAQADGIGFNEIK